MPVWNFDFSALLAKAGRNAGNFRLLFGMLFMKLCVGSTIVPSPNKPVTVYSSFGRFLSHKQVRFV
jgi:hypothetical protein